MLQIRPAQMAALEASVEGQLVASIMRFLRKDFASECAPLDDEALRALASNGVESAKRHGITARWDAARFVACQVCLGRSFDMDPDHAWPQSVLSRKDLPPSRKMDWILRHYVEPRRKRAQRQDGVPQELPSASAR